VLSYIHLVDLPAVADSAAARLGGVGQQRREAHHPTVGGHVVDLDTALSEQFFDVAEGQPDAYVPADSYDDDVGRDRKPAKAERGGVDGRERLSGTHDPESHRTSRFTVNATGCPASAREDSTRRGRVDPCVE
jgi:hypothetical protein